MYLKDLGGARIKMIKKRFGAIQSEFLNIFFQDCQIKFETLNL